MTSRLSIGGNASDPPARERIAGYRIAAGQSAGRLTTSLTGFASDYGRSDRVPCPLRSESDETAAQHRSAALCQERTSPGSFDLFRSAYKHRRRNRQAKYLRGFEVNCEIKYGR